MAFWEFADLDGQSSSKPGAEVEEDEAFVLFGEAAALFVEAAALFEEARKARQEAASTLGVVLRRRWSEEGQVRSISYICRL